MKVGVIDTGACNLNSVCQACLRGGADITVSHEPSEMQDCDKYILPGVGTAQAVMDGIRQYRLRDFILGIRKPMLGICLGMQIQAKSSEEVPQGSGSGGTECLGMVDAVVRRFPSENLILPHMGWDQVHFGDHPLFRGLKQDCFFYFVHSYCMPVVGSTIATCTYGIEFSAAIARDNFMGVQFHPEKSGEAGQRLYENFFSL